MSLRHWFASKRKAQTALNPEQANERLNDEDMEQLWVQCYNCAERLARKAVAENLHVCPGCGYHFRIGAYERIAQLTDRFEEMDAGMRPLDPLLFTDTEPYADRIKKAETHAGLSEAVITGLGYIRKLRFALAVMDFAYMGGSMGSVVGEKITRLVETAIEHQLPLIIVSSSGGARMQEGTFSLMQMVKTGSALGRFHEAGLLYISLLTEPTFGGVTASFGTLGDIIIAEEGARIGFAGRRVIEQTIRQKLPPDFQTSGYLLQYGQVDRVAPRHALKEELYQLMDLHQRVPAMPIPL
jgi:acetyl-CoA carboxylase carboxyl transferase subunit beta